MTIDTLYDIIKKQVVDDTLIIGADLADGTYKNNLFLLDISQLQINDCSVSKQAEKLYIMGSTGTIDGAVKFQEGNICITTRQSTDGSFVSQVSITVRGVYLFEDLLGTLAPFITHDFEQEDSLFSGFSFTDPILEFDDTVYEITIKSNAAIPPKMERWKDYSAFLSDSMLVEGKLVPNNFYYPLLDVIFSTSQPVALPIGSGNGRLEIQTMNDNTLYETWQVTNAFILYDIYVLKLNEILTFRMPLFSSGEERQFTAAFSPPLTIGNVTQVLKDILMLPDQMMLMPKGAFLSSFGLEQLDIIYGAESAADAEEAKHMRAIFALGKPLELFIPNLTLDQFQAAWEQSNWMGEGMAVTLFMAAEANLKLGNFLITGVITAYFPYMQFTGRLSLKEQGTLQDFAQACDVTLPDAWKAQSGNEEEANVIGILDVTADALQRSLRLEASANGILRLEISDQLSFELKDISVEISYCDSSMAFSIAGTLAFHYQEGSSDEDFAFTLSAAYANQNWKFTGTLAYGQVDLVMLIKSVLNLPVEDPSAGVELQDFLISYDTGEKELLLYASCEVWFTILGITPTLGGRILLRQKGEEKSAQLAAYLEVEELKLLLLAQVDDIYALAKKYLFRIQFADTYIQAVYEKKEHELLTIEFNSDTTLGDIVLALIHLINPNARNALASPWNVLNQIKFNFTLTVDMTDKKITLLYPIELNLAGIIKLKSIGLSYTYDGKDRKIEYMLTGSCLGQEFTTDNPFAWDALNGSPQENVAADEKKFNVYYLGIGNHLDLDVSGDTISAMLEDIRQKLRPLDDVTGFSYRDNAGWLIAADLELTSIIRVRVLLYDPEVYGAAIELDLDKESDASPLKFLSGLALELFYKKISDETGMFHCRLTLPKKYSQLDLGAVTLYFGEILLEVYTNGSFYLDLGFPHDRDFSKSWGVSVGFYTGKGGVYLGVFHGDAVNSVPAITNGAFSPVVKIGIGLSIGLSRSFDLGVVQGGVSLMAVGIFEGIFAIFNPVNEQEDKALYYKVSATVGITGSLFVSVDFKIIAVGASAQISAFCTLDLESYRRAKLSVDLDLSLSAYVKILFIKVSFSFHFHHQAEFYFGSDQDTPWKLDMSGQNIGQSLPGICLTPSDPAEAIEISPVVVPLCSVAETKSYCMAFLAFLDTDDFRAVLDLLFSLLCSGEIKNIDYDSVQELFAKYIQVNVNLSVDVGERQNEEVAGTVFPMLPQLSLELNEGETIDFGRRTVTADYMRELSLYFEKLNADPDYTPVQASADDTEIPIGGALLVDWVQMIIKELEGQVSRAVQNLGRRTNRREASEITLAKGMTLKQLSADQDYDEDNAATKLWENVAGIYGMVGHDIAVDMEHYVFDNTTAGLDPEEAAALFYVRLHEIEVLYAPYAEYILEHNPEIDMAWACGHAGETTLNLPQGRVRAALAGDSVIRLAKACALLDGLYEDSGWQQFRQQFLDLNQNKGQSYALFGQYKLDGYAATLSALFCRYYPDFRNNPQDYPMWGEEILCAGKSFRMAQPSQEQADPEPITYSMLKELIFSDENVEEISAIVSRVFLQGTRIADPDTGEQRPMYEVLGQQITLPDELQDYTLKLLCGSGDSWIHVPAEEQPLSAETIRGWLPESVQETLKKAGDIPAFSDQTQCFTMAEGWKLADGNGVSYLGLLPQAASSYIANHHEFPVVEKDAAAIQDIQWASVVDIRLYRKGPGVYYVLGVKAEELGLLYAIVSESGYLPECRLYSHTSRLTNEHNALLPIADGGCTIIKTNLSKETHYVSAANAGEAMEYVADISDGQAFLKLLWECTVIGGGYWLHFPNDDMDESLFDDEGYGEIVLAASYRDGHENRSAINAVFMPAEPMGTALYGELETVKCPTLPAGCVGIEAERSFDNENRFQSLFQLLGYEAAEAAGEKKVYESAPVLPAPGETNAEDLRYQMVLPMWKLYGTTGDNPYAAVGEQSRLTLFLRDVLGNRIQVATEQQKDGNYDVRGVYNDFLIGLHELPATKWSYSFAEDDGEYLIIKGEATEQAFTNQDQAASLIRARQQLSCNDMGLSLSVSTCDAELPQTALGQLLAYIDALYEYLLQSEDLQEDPPHVEIRCPLQMKAAQEVINPVRVYISINRPEALCAAGAPDDVKTAKSSLTPAADYNGKSFAESFAAVFPQFRLAYDGDNQPVGVSIEMLTNYGESKYAIAPYELKVNGETVYSPEFYALTPLTTSLVTREVEIETQEGGSLLYTFVNADANQWEKQLLADIENLLTGSNVCTAARLCPQKADTLVSVKGQLAEALARRVMPVRSDAAAEIPADVLGFVQERFRKDLNLAYDTDVIAAFMAFWTDNTLYRMDSRVDNDICLSAAKLQTSSQGTTSVFCLCLQEPLTETNSLLEDGNLSFPYLEYHIEEGIEGYEKSEWLRFDKPVTEGHDLKCDLKVPYPKKECPLPPKLLQQKYDTQNQQYPNYNWSCQIEAGLCSQDTLYLQVEYEELHAVEKNAIESQIEVLARYQVERSEIMGMLETPEQFADAYTKIVSYAAQYAESAGNPIAAHGLTEAAGTAVLIELGFEFGESGVVVSVLNEDEVKAKLDSLGAKLVVPTIIDTVKTDGSISFEVKIEGLSVLQCNQIMPKAQIVRNADLFHNAYIQVRDSFIFRTEVMELPPVWVSGLYTTALEFEDKDLKAVVSKMWQYLQVEKYRSVVDTNLTVFYTHPVNDSYGQIMTRTPVTFMADVESAEAIVDNLKNWEGDLTKGCLLVDTVIYQRNSDTILTRTSAKLTVQET